MKQLYTLALGLTLSAFTLNATPIDIKPKNINDWKLVGTCEFTEDILTTKTKTNPVTYDVKVEQSEANQGFYRIVNPYGKGTPYYGKVGDHVLDQSKDHYIYINAMDPDAVFIPTSDLRMAEEWDDYGETSLAVMSKGYFNGVVDEYGYSSLAEQAELGHMGRLADGYITFPANEIYLCEGDYRYGGDNANLSGAFSLKLPGAKNYTVADYDVSTYCYSASNNNGSIGWLTVGGACSQAYFHCVKGEFNDAAIAATLAEGQPIIESDESDPDLFWIIYGASMRYYVKNDTEKTKYTALLVTVDQQKNVKNVYTKEFYHIPDNDTSWEPLGEGQFTDAILSAFYGDKKPKTYAVAVEQHKNKPGYYRIVNPYGEKYPGYKAEAFGDKHAHNHYIFIDATDPECVILEESPVGADYGNHGDARVSSAAAQALAAGTMTTAQIKTKKLCGTLADGKITFPSGSLRFSERQYIAGNWRKANGKTVLTLPAGNSGIGSVTADSDAAPVYYNLHGVRVDNPTPGIYIVKQGDKVQKVTVR